MPEPLVILFIDATVSRRLSWCAAATRLQWPAPVTVTCASLAAPTDAAATAEACATLAQVQLARVDFVVTLDESVRRAATGPAAVLVAPGALALGAEGVMTLHLPDIDPTEQANAQHTLQAHLAALLEGHLVETLLARRRRRSLVAGVASRQATPSGAEPAQPAVEVFHGMVGGTPVMRKLFKTIRKTAQSDLPVLILGETGVGKEPVARALHEESDRRDMPFIAVNCAALPENLVESELFGHVGGAFTGANQPRRGRFELADGGTIFLDEIGDLPPQIQVKLLRVLQERCFERVGIEKTQQVDVRVLSATNRDLEQGVRSGWFRGDLFYRLNVLPIHVPPLRERREDIPALATHVLQGIGRETGRYFRGLPMEAVDRFLAYDWPGNVRELINVVQRAAVQSSGDEICIAPLDNKAASGGRQAPALSLPAQAGRSAGRPAKLKDSDIQRAMAWTGGNCAAAAERLGIARSTLYRYLERMGKS